ncbi:hypothetical protein CK203_073346 [Vitis vinifera]|uniref:Uncharacterized protein n=1 Tax=Vitis vinifera TaxID=29760 RepID=A0A438ESF7_VITVI|nr:hypothetical protein CK203_073346 [Vitis vinifera]
MPRGVTDKSRMGWQLPRSLMHLMFSLTVAIVSLSNSWYKWAFINKSSSPLPTGPTQPTTVLPPTVPPKRGALPLHRFGWSLWTHPPNPAGDPGVRGSELTLPRPPNSQKILPNVSLATDNSDVVRTKHGPELRMLRVVYAVGCFVLEGCVLE